MSIEKYQHGGGANFGWMDETPTPRTDAAWNTYGDDYELELFARQLERELTEIRAALGDDGRRTHKELILLATKAAEWRTWKEKYIDLRNAHIAEGQDPAGTIWEHADKLQKELKETKAEAAKLNNQLLKTESDLLQSQDINSFLDTEFRIACKRAEKAEAEVERLKKELDAWDYGTRAKREQEARKKAEAEVERLKLLLSDLLILTEKNYWNSHNYNQIKKAFNPTDK
jgi:chromosome segregation ATPase